MTSNGDNCSSPVRTRGQWRRESKGDLEDYYQSKYEKEDVPTETKELVQDQIFHSFVEVNTLFWNSESKKIFDILAESGQP